MPSQIHRAVNHSIQSSNGVAISVRSVPKLSADNDVSFPRFSVPIYLRGLNLITSFFAIVPLGGLINSSGRWQSFCEALQSAPRFSLCFPA
jgi:hypothetical protein